ncbi:MAG TPA: PAS domain S-box protein [Flavisolibacter sp.]|nr:PAS domain S-box protein [Flavisolibacter sp.]
MRTTERSASDLFKTDLLIRHPLPTWIIDSPDCGICLANTAACQFYGYQPETFSDLCFLQLFAEESRLSFLKKITETPSGTALSLTARMLTAAGNPVIAELYAAPLPIDNKLYYQVTAVDITSRTLAQQQLEEEHARYKTYFEQSSEGIFCQEFSEPIDIDLPLDVLFEQARERGFIAACNDAMARMYGFEKASELRGMASRQLLDYEDPANIAYFTAFVKGGFKIIDAESQEKTRSGDTRFFLNNTIGIIEDGKLVRIWGTQQDITGKKKTEQKLKLLADLVEQTSDILTAADLDYRPVTWNSAAERIYGLTAAQAIGSDLRKYFVLHYQNTTREVVRKIIAEKGEWRGETCFTRPTDKKTVTLWMSFKLMKDEENRALGFLVSATDITERKEAESRLKESENRFREMADCSPIMIWMSNENNETTYINRKWQAFTGEDITSRGTGWSDLVHPADLEKAKGEFDRAFSQKQPVTVIYRLRSAGGSYRWVHDSSVPRFLADGSFVGYIGSAVDIQDQKEKEEQLHYQAMVLENVSDILVTTDLDFRVTTFNKTAEEHYGIAEADALGKRMSQMMDFRFAGSSLDAVIADLRSIGIWKGEVSVEINGQTKHYLHSIKYIFDENHNKIGFLSSGKDITERKLADEKLRESELFYRTLIDDSHNAILLLDEQANITFASNGVETLLGYKTADVIGTNGFDYVKMEDLTWAMESFSRELQERPEIKSIIVRLKKADGSWLWCMVRGHNMLNNPYIKSMVVYFHDDSQRKKANDALKESEKRFRDLIRDMQIGVILLDKEGRAMLCNEAFANTFGLDKEELIGMPIREIALDPIHEDGRPFAEEETPAYKVTHTRQAVKDVVMGNYRAKTGDRVWILINADPVLDAQGEIIHVVCSVKDMTDRKKMEADQLAKQISHQRQLTQATIDGQENERQEIGKELHDNIGQQLTTIKLFLDLAKTTADDTTNEMVSMALKGVSDVINEVRAISRTLVPSTLKDLGLVDSINELIESIGRAQLLTFDFDHSDFCEEGLAENQQLTVFRMVQEQLNNIVKHARARQVFIRLRTTAAGFSLEIGDDGQGFDPQKTPKGLGFVNMRNRAGLFGGQVEVLSSPGKGCIVKVDFPEASSN